MKKLVITLIQIIDPKKTSEVKEFLQVHLEQIYGTEKFSNVTCKEVFSSNIQQITLLAKSIEDWENYEDGDGFYLRRRFMKDLIEPNLVKVISVIETDVELVKPIMA